MNTDQKQKKSSLNRFKIVKLDPETHKRLKMFSTDKEFPTIGDAVRALLDRNEAAQKDLSSRGAVGSVSEKTKAEARS